VLECDVCRKGFANQKRAGIAMSDAEARIRAGGKSFRDHLAVEPIVQIDGVVVVPGGAGPGIEIDRAVIERYRV
jgi:L-alanine-DL-glutamate epimerase-like enolase superfamily enzyme